MKCFLQLLVVGFLALTIEATPFSRIRRQIVFPNEQSESRDPTLVRGGFTGFGQFQPGQDFRGTGRGGLTVAGNGGRQIFNPINPPPPIGAQPGNGITEGNLAGGSFNSGFDRQREDQARALNELFVREQRQAQGFVLPEESRTTTARPAPGRTTASPEFLSCLQRCPTVNQYNPVCGSDGENYHNEYRLACARRCGSNVEMVRAGTCQPL